MATWGDTKTTSTGGNISMKLKAGYDSVSHSGNTVYAKIYGAMTMAGNTWSKNQFGIWIPSGGTKHVVKNSGTQSKSGTWYEASQNCSWDVGTQAGGTKSVSVGFGWNGWTATQGNTASVSFSYPAASLWNDINAWNPGVTAQNGLIFNLSTSDGGSWTNITNEPSDFTKPYGTTATISNIRSNVTGAHYSSNSVTGTASSTISWTFTTANYSVEIYTAWDTYTISYNANGGSSTPSAQTKTYGTNLTIANSISRANSTANGYTVTFNANEGSVSPTSKTATDTTSYSFTGWKSSATGTVWSGGATNFSENNATTLTAQWSSSTTKGSITTPSATRSNGTATRTVTFDATTNGGTCSTSSLNSTATITYTGNGWYTATSGGTKRCANGGSYTPSASETVYQQWSSSTGSYSAVTLPAATKASTTSTRTVTFNANQGTTTKTSQNSTATVTYSQTGWWTASSGGTNRGNSGATYTPSAAEKVYAQFSSSTGSYSAVTLPTTSECTRSGYKLLGFSTSDTATTATYVPGASYTPTATTTTLYAVWQLDQAVVWVKKQLPPEYQAVEYIESSGTQFINTGLIGKSTMYMEGKIQTPTTLSDFKNIIGANPNRVYIQTDTNGTKWSFGANNYANEGSISANTIYEFKASYGNNAYLSINDEVVARFTNTNTYNTGSNNMYIFARNSNGTSDNKSSHKLYYIKIYDNNVLVRNFIPCYRKSDNVVGLYDIINDVFYTNRGTGTFSKGANVVGSWVKGKVWVKGNIPTAYQEVEYIQTDGNQVVDIGIVGDGTTSIYDIQFAAANHRQLMGFGGNSREYWGANSGTKFELGGSGRLITETIDTTQRYKIIWTYDKTNSITKMTYSNANYSGERVDEETLTQDVTNRHYYLFNIYNNTNDYTCSCKLYSLEVISRDGECLRHLVPCYRKADSVIGLYDTIGDEFYTNTISGTSLTKGSNVSNPHWVKAKKFYTKQSGAWVENKTT